MTPRNGFVSDPTGFPMLWCEEIGAYAHWLPVTKIQFEYFLCDAPDAHFDADWYDMVLALNPRATPRKISAANYWHVLMTGVRPSEAQRFASWCGEGFRLPTETEWRGLFHALRNEPAQDAGASSLLDGRSDRVQEVLKRLDAAGREMTVRMRCGPSLATQMLLRFGAMEWVEVGDPPSAWGTKGEPVPQFCGNLDLLERPGDPLTADPESCRFAAAGFRLLWSPPSDRGAGQTANGPGATQTTSSGGR